MPMDNGDFKRSRVQQRSRRIAEVLPVGLGDDGSESARHLSRVEKRVSSDPPTRVLNLHQRAPSASKNSRWRMGWVTGFEPATSGATVESDDVDGLGFSCFL